MIDDAIMFLVDASAEGILTFVVGAFIYCATIESALKIVVVSTINNGALAFVAGWTTSFAGVSSLIEKIELN